MNSIPDENGKRALVDFDGVLYLFDADEIRYSPEKVAGPPIREGVELLKKLREDGYYIYLVSARVVSKEARSAIFMWLYGYDLNNLVDSLTDVYVPCDIFICPRAMRDINYAQWFA